MQGSLQKKITKIRARLQELHYLAYSPDSTYLEELPNVNSTHYQAFWPPPWDNGPWDNWNNWSNWNNWDNWQNWDNWDQR